MAPRRPASKFCGVSRGSYRQADRDRSKAPSMEVEQATRWHFVIEQAWWSLVRLWFWRHRLQRHGLRSIQERERGRIAHVWAVDLPTEDRS